MKNSHDQAKVCGKNDINMPAELSEVVCWQYITNINTIRNRHHRSTSRRWVRTFKKPASLSVSPPPTVCSYSETELSHVEQNTFIYSQLTADGTSWDGEEAVITVSLHSFHALLQWSRGPRLIS